VIRSLLFLGEEVARLELEEQTLRSLGVQGGYGVRDDGMSTKE
jgi:hypothetical protein